MNRKHLTIEEVWERHEAARLARLAIPEPTKAEREAREYQRAEARWKAWAGSGGRSGPQGVEAESNLIGGDATEIRNGEADCWGGGR